MIAAVRRAVEELLVETTAEQLTVSQVAERAGVHTTSIYRRWGDIGSLIADVARYKLDPSRPLVRSGDLRSDVLDWASALARHFGTPENTALLRAGAALSGDVYDDCTAQWRDEASAIVEASGAGRTVEPRVLVDHVLAPIVFHAIFSKAPLGDGEVRRLVDEALTPR